MAADRLGLKKNKLAQDAIEAAVAAIERNNYRIVVPIEFEVTHIPVATGKAEALAAGGRPAVPAGGRSSGSTSPRPAIYTTNEGDAPSAARITSEPQAPGHGSKPRSRK